jgi:hypothetical protein
MSGYILNPDSVGDPDQTPRVQLLGYQPGRRSASVGRHVFAPEPDVTDWQGKPGCLHCPLPEGHDIHHLPETSPEARDRDASILGEREEDE